MAKNVVVVGTQWGDEGKGKIVDWLTDRARGTRVAVELPGQTQAPGEPPCDRRLVRRAGAWVLEKLEPPRRHDATKAKAGNGTARTQRRQG